MTEKISKEERKEREKVVQSLSVCNYESQKTTADFVVNEIANGRMTGKQGDVINTSSKVVQNGERLRLSYLRFYYEIYKKDGITSDQIIKKAGNLVPSFFSLLPLRTKQIE